MSGHVVYACACLNIKLHLANKYLLNNHKNDRAECFIRSNDPSIEGRQFELGMGGVQAEYNTLTTTQLVGTDLSWMTVTCLNCSTGNVYSVQRPTSERRYIETYPVDIHSLYRPGDRVIIHNNTVYGNEIDQIKQKQNYSNNFKIVLNTDASAEKENEGFNDKTKIPGDLYSQHGQLRQILEQSLKQIELATEQRIELFRQEQLQRLERDSEQAKCDCEFLWHKILEASRTVNEEKQVRKRLMDSDHHRVALENNNTSTTTTLDSNNHVRFASNNDNEKQQQQNESATSSYSRQFSIQQQIATPSTSSFIAPSSLRRTSFALDERVITSSWKRTNVPDLSHLNNNNNNNQGSSIEENFKKENDDLVLSDQDEESDGLFDLDEEIDVDDCEDDDRNENEVKDNESIQKDPSSSSLSGMDKNKSKPSSGSYQPSSLLSSSVDWTKRRRKSNTKYLSVFEEDNDDDDYDESRNRSSNGNDLLSSSVSAYATSVPIAISHNNEYINDAMKQLPNENVVNPADQDPTTTALLSSSIQKNTAQNNDKETISSSPSSQATKAYDQFSLADQEASKLFPANERRRKSIAAVTTINIGTTPRPQLDSLVGRSLDTRRRPSALKNSFIAEHHYHHETNSEDEQEGPMVPPHILAANTFTDETEELFGSVPRSNTWRKTYD